MESFVGIDIGGTKITAINMKNHETQKHTKNDTGAGRPLKDIMESLFNTIKEVWTDDVKAIGIGVPGILDVDQGKIISINNIRSFNGLELKTEVEKKFGVPVYVNNDANCFALSEAFFGAGVGYKNIVGITMGTGLGGGVVINSKVYSGNLGAAGEFGCIPYLDSTFEEYCGSRFFISHYQKTGKELFDLAESGDEEALKAFDTLGHHLGILITHVMFFIAPQAVIIGGSISTAFKYFKPALDKMLDEFSIPVIAEHVKIYPAELKDSGVLGAAALAISNS